MNDLDNAINNLKILYLKKLESEVYFYQDILEGDITLEKAMELLKMVHKTGGTSGMYGFKDLSMIATLFEEYLMKIKNNEETLDKENIKTRTVELIEQIKHEICKETI